MTTSFRHFLRRWISCYPLQSVLNVFMKTAGSVLPAIAILTVFTATASAEIRSIQEFMKFEANWESFVATDYEWQLEGRYAFISDGTLTFTNCPLPFRISTEQSNNRGSSGVVEVTGKIVKEEKGLAFKISRLTPLPRDTERLRTMRGGINSLQADNWYTLAAWARGRGEFYNDKDLLTAAADLDRNGILTELRQLKVDDEAGYATLLTKARDKQLDESLIQQMTHDLLVSRSLLIRNRPFAEAAWRGVIKQIQTDLAAGSEPLSEFPFELNRIYQENPQETYAAAPQDRRTTLTRLFVVDLLTHVITQRAAKDGSNGFAIADQLRIETPERTDLIQQYDNAEIAWRMERIPVSTRLQLDEFTTRLEKSGHEDRVMEVRQNWLTARAESFRQDGARGLADLAQEYLALLKDEDKAVELYIEAWKINPEYAPATEWLTARNYHQVDSTWISDAEFKNRPLSPMEQAIREGRVEIGMTAAQVQAALGIAPSSITRVASRKQITEWWVYRDTGVLIELVKPQRAAESTVIRLESLSAP